LLGGQGGDGVWSHDDINLERNQLSRKSGKPLELALGISVFDHEVAALDVTEVTQSLTEGLVRVGPIGQVGRHVAYSSDLARLLGLGGERRKSEADSEPDQPHATIRRHRMPLAKSLSRIKRQPAAIAAPWSSD
jgi:hypothetical protein